MKLKTVAWFVGIEEKPFEERFSEGDFKGLADFLDSLREFLGLDDVELKLRDTMVRGGNYFDVYFETEESIVFVGRLSDFRTGYESFQDMQESVLVGFSYREEDYTDYE